MKPASAESGFSSVRAQSPGARHWFWMVSAILSGLMIPVLVVLLGMATRLLDEGALPAGELRFGRYLVVPVPESFAARDAAGQLVTLVFVGVGLSLLHTLALWFSYRGVLSRTGEATERLHQRMLEHMIARANEEGVASHRARAQHLIEDSLPQLRVGLLHWWRAIPRSVVLLIGCATVALLVEPWLAALGAIAGLLVWRVVVWVHDDSEDEEATWELPEARRRLVELMQQAPLLARVQPVHGLDGVFAQHLRTLRAQLQREDSRWAKTIPIVVASVSLAVAVLILALGGNVLSPNQPLDLSAALVLILGLVFAAFAGVRLILLWRELGPARSAADAVFGFLSFQQSVPSNVLVGLNSVRDAIALKGVRLLDSHQRALLDEVSVEFRPGTVTALLGSDPLALQALMELLMGYGRPSGGSVQFDGTSSADLHPVSLAKQVLWISEDGPIWSGTVEENIRSGGDASLDQIVQATRELGVYDQIQMLPEGFRTMIGPNDGRIADGLDYSIALARAMVKRAAVVLIQESARRDVVNVEDRSNELFARLAKSGAVVVIVPRRLTTLRSADRVLLLHQGKLVVEGTHQKLLETNELYRHLNYLLFNPYRER